MVTTELDIWNLALARVGDFSISVEAAKAVTSASATNPVVVTATAHGLLDGNLVLLEAFDMMTQVSGRIFEVVSATANTFALRGEDGSLYAAETGGTAKRLESGKHVSNAFLQWPIVRDEVLRLHPWNCAEKRTRLARLQAAKTITGATAANPVVITATAHGYTTGDAALIDGIAGMVELNGRYFAVTVLTANTYSLNGEDGTTYAAYTSGGTSRKALTPLRPDFGYDCRFPLPSDFLRALELSGSRETWQVVGGELHTDAGPTVPLRYIYRVTDPAVFDAALRSLLGARLAVDICERLRESNTKKDSLRSEYEELRKAATGADGQEQSAVPPDSDEWELARL